MNRQFQFLVALIVLLAGNNFACAQSIQNVKASPIQDGKVAVTYDILGAKANQKFNIELYGSQNNFSSPLTSVAGDVGKDITGGAGKKIVWNASEELDDYKGEMNFRVKGSLMPVAFVFQFPAERSSIRRGKKTSLKWEGGIASQKVKLELFKGSERIDAIAETNNIGTYTWTVPKNLEKGNYTLKITSGQENVSSQPFAIKSKIPFALKVLPVLVLGGAVAALSGGGSKGTPASDLPVAPNPK